MSTQPYRISIIIGSTRQNRFADKPAQWVYKTLSQREDAQPELLDLRDYPLPFFDEPVGPASAPQPFNNPTVRLWTQKIDESDGFVIISPEYNHGYTAVLKNALDYVYREWNQKPAAIVSYGGVGGARSVEQLQQVLIALQIVPVHRPVLLPAEQWKKTKTGELDVDQLFASSQSNLDAVLENLLWWTRVLKSARENRP